MIWQMVSVKGVKYKKNQKIWIQASSRYVNHLTSLSSEFSFLKIAPPYQRQYMSEL